MLVTVVDNTTPPLGLRTWAQRTPRPRGSFFLGVPHGSYPWPREGDGATVAGTGHQGRRRRRASAPSSRKGRNPAPSGETKPPDAPTGPRPDGTATRSPGESPPARKRPPPRRANGTRRADCAPTAGRPETAKPNAPGEGTKSRCYTTHRRNTSARRGTGTGSTLRSRVTVCPQGLDNKHATVLF